ncbi:MAG: Abi family protein [Bacteroidaceae bacterium]|nr:Abi family protein [Clostridia bacterium]MBR1940706.1 Abi family protein [Bacteroidaceae bacterium]
MRYDKFEEIFSAERMRKYNYACSGNTKRAMTLYRYNLRLSQEMFTMISCFEVALRNKIDREMRIHFGNDWLRDSVMPSGILTHDHRTRGSKLIIEKAYNELVINNLYSHSKLLSEMEFGVWKYMFNNVQYRLYGRHLLHIFPQKPKSSLHCQYDNTYVFNELHSINIIRNRIAHHEPICFNATSQIDTNQALSCYTRIMTMFQWMEIDAGAMLYGLDHVGDVCGKIMCI